MAEVGSAFVSLVPSAKGFGSATEKQVGGEMSSAGKSVGSKFGSAIKVGALAAVGGAFVVGRFLKGTLDEAREAQVVGARTDNVIKKMGASAWTSSKGIAAFAGELSTKVGIDDEAIQSGENLLLTFGNIQDRFGKGNDIFRQTTSLMVDMSSAMGQDMKSSAIQLGKALNDPTKGVTALTRVGVAFTDQQKAQIKKLQESGNILGAQKIILGEVKKEFSGSAAAMATPGQKVAVAWGNVKEQIGTYLLPIVDRFLRLLLSAMPTVTRLIDGIGPAFGKVKAFVAPAVDAVQGLLTTFKGSGEATSLLSSLGDIADTVKANFQVLPALDKLLAKFHEWQPTIEKVIEVVVKIVGAVLRLAAAILGKVLPVLIRFAGFMIKNMVDAIVKVADVIKWMWNNAFEPVFKFIFKAITSVLQHFGEFLQLLGHAPGMGWVGDLGDKMVAASKKVDEVSNAIQKIPDHKTVTVDIFTNLHRRSNESGGFGAVPAMANGGIVTKPTLALIGEAGPEAVVPLSKMSSTLAQGRDAVGGDSRRAIHIHLGDREFVRFIDERIDTHVDLTREHARASR